MATSASTTSSTSSTARSSRPSAAEARKRRRRSPRSGNTSRSRPTGGSSSPARTSTRSTSARRTTPTPRSPSPRPRPGKMILCEKPLSMDLVEGQKMVERRREGRRPQYRLVQLPEGPGRRARQAVHRRRPARPDLPLPGQLPARLDDLGRPPAGGHRSLAARRRRGWLGGHRRPPGPLHRHRTLAERPGHVRSRP